MAYYPTEKPDNETVKSSLKERYFYHINEAEKLKKFIDCEHNWEMREEQDYDGHRTDTYEVWHCTKCKLKTNW